MGALEPCCYVLRSRRGLLLGIEIIDHNCRAQPAGAARPDLSLT